MNTTRAINAVLITSLLASSNGFFSVASFAAEPLATPVLAPPAGGPTIETSCGLIVLNGISTEVRIDSKLHVLNTKSINLPKVDANVMAFVCNRDSIIPVQDDDRIVQRLPAKFVINDGTRSGTLSFENKKYKYTVTGGVLAKAEKQTVDTQLRAMQEQAKARDKKKSGGKKVLGCVAGGLVTGLLAGLLAPKRDRGAAVVIGFAAGCAVGWTFAKNWSEKDKHGLEDASQDALDSPNGQSGWQAPESGAQVSFQTTNAAERNEDIEFDHLETVQEPPDGSRVVAKPFRTVARVALRSSPDGSASDNITGRFNSGQTVQVIALTPDLQWAMIGEDGVIVGYASRQGLTELAQPLRKAQTERHFVVNEAAAPAPTPKRKAKARSQAASPVMAAQVAAPPDRSQVRTTRIAATTQCKTLVAVTGQQQDKKTGCNSPDGKWRIA